MILFIALMVTSGWLHIDLTIIFRAVLEILKGRAFCDMPLDVDLSLQSKGKLLVHPRD